jgi:hypothetical protein
MTNDKSMERMNEIDRLLRKFPKGFWKDFEETEKKNRKE